MSRVRTFGTERTRILCPGCESDEQVPYNNDSVHKSNPNERRTVPAIENCLWCNISSSAAGVNLGKRKYSNSFLIMHRVRNRQIFIVGAKQVFGAFRRKISI